MAVDLSQQAVEARAAGIAEVVRLLQQPEDLANLPELISEYENKLKANKTALSALVQSQVEATRHGLELLDKSHRHIIKLRGCIDRINQLCQECTSLVENQEKIRLLSTTQSNIQKVLSEIKDIIDLPDRAEMVLGLMEDTANVLPAYEALTVLEGIAENAQAAWNRNVKAAKHDMTSMMQYLDRVKDVMAEFEVLLWEQLDSFEVLAKENPTLLVDCLRVIEMQERLDKQYAKSTMEGFSPKHFRDTLIMKLEHHVAAKFEHLEELVRECGVPNKQLKYDQEGDIILEDKRDYLGNLVMVKRANRLSGRIETITDEEELRTIDVIEEEVFDEDAFLDEALDELYDKEADLADTYDYVAPCFPPSYNIFLILMGYYHVHVATVIDTLGQKAGSLSNKGALRVMEFVRKYMETLRGLGIEEGLVRLPRAPDADPDSKPGLDALMGCYIERMETTVCTWYRNILEVDLQGEPKPGPNGKLRTPGVTDFFRILNEEIEVIRSIDDHGEVMYQTTIMALRIMKGFQDAQSDAIGAPHLRLSFEMFCALLNNNVECHDQSLEFAEEARGLLDEEYRSKVDIEEVCRGFLEVAKVALRRMVEVMFNDPGMSTHLKALYSAPDWFEGRTTSTLIATIKDYMSDVLNFVEQSFVKRVAEAALEEFVKRAVNIFITGLPPVTDTFVRRMAADEEDFGHYFEQYLKLDRLSKHVQQLADMRELLCSDDVPSFVLAYANLLQVHSGFTLEVVQKTLGARNGYGGLEKKQAKEAIAQCKEVWKQRAAAIAAAEGQKQEESRGFFSFFGRG